MLSRLSVSLAYSFVFLLPLLAQDQPGAPPASQQRITGSIAAVDSATHRVKVKEDKTGTVYSVELQNTKSLRKVDPVSLDLKTATRITADDLMVGDRVQVFASKAEDNPDALAARGLILISARDLQSVHQEQAAAWQHATGGVVTQVQADNKLLISARTLTGVKAMTVDAQDAEFSRYSLENPKVPAASRLADIQVGDQVRVIGDAAADGSTLAAKKIYSSPVRMLVCTVSAVSPDGKQITLKNLQDNQTVTVTLNDDSAVRKLPPMMAMGLARRLNPSAAGPAGAPNGSITTANSLAGAGNPQAGAKQGEGSPAANNSWRGGAGGDPNPASPGGSGGAMRPGGGMRNGDMSQMLERVPKMNAAELKPGDAVMVAGLPVNNDKSHLLATNVIAGVEPIFQSASPRQMQSLGDWGLTAGAGGMDGAPQQ